MNIPRRHGTAALCLALVLTCGCSGEPNPRPTHTPETVEPEPASNSDQQRSAAQAEPEPTSTPDPEQPSMQIETGATDAIEVDKPIVLRLQLSQELSELVGGLGSGTAPALRLTLEGLQTPDAKVSVRVFVNHPGAGPETSIDDPRYLGDVGFYPTAPPTDADDPGGTETSFLLDIGSALADLPAEQRLLDGNAIDVTLFAVPLLDSAERLGEVTIPFDGIRLSAHP